MPALTKIVSLTNFVVASSALCFQVGVLYPWHKELDENFEKLKKEHMMVLDLIKNSADIAAARQSKLVQQPPPELHRKGGLRDWFGLGPRSLD